MTSSSLSSSEKKEIRKEAKKINKDREKRKRKCNNEV